MLRIRNVSGMIINCSGFPAQVLPSELNRMHEMCDESDVYHSAIIDNGGFEYGQNVIPKGGPFADHIGKFDSRNKRGDLVALFTLFGRDQKLTFRSGDLLAA